MTDKPKPIDCRCWICNARPGERCWSLIDARRTLEVFHFSRGKDMGR